MKYNRLAFVFGIVAITLGMTLPTSVLAKEYPFYSNIRGKWVVTKCCSIPWETIGTLDNHRGVECNGTTSSPTGNPAACAGGYPMSEPVMQDATK